MRMITLIATTAAALSAAMLLAGPPMPTRFVVASAMTASAEPGASRGATASTCTTATGATTETIIIIDGRALSSMYLAPTSK